MTPKFLHAAVASREPLVNLTRDIVAIKSFSAQEGEVIRRLRAEMEKLGYDEVRIDPMGNLIGRIGNGPVKVAIDGHCDTVDIGDISQWKTNPFDPVLKDGIIYGRGTCDQKGGLAAAVYSAAILKQVGLPKSLSLYVVASVQEEDCDGLCWQYIVKEDRLRPDVVLLTEPSSLTICHGQRGRMEMEITTTGVSCHGSAPERGVNAIYKMAPIIEDISGLNEKLKPCPPFTKGSITVSEIRSRSPSLCAVADGCTIHIDRRLTLGETENTAVCELAELPGVRKSGAQITVCDYRVPSYTGLTYPTKKYYPTWKIDETSREVHTAVRAYTDTFNEKPNVGYWTFSTNGIATAGMFGIPTIGFGPGHERFAHAPNEQVEVEHLVRACAFYAAFAETFANG